MIPIRAGGGILEKQQIHGLIFAARCAKLFIDLK
jgi:hypothetical protein